MRRSPVLVISLLAFTIGTARANPAPAGDDPRHLETQAQHAFQAKNFEQAIVLYRRQLRALAASKPADGGQRISAGVHYNLACALALLGRSKEALVELQRAVEGGGVTRAWAERDTDLASLRGLPAFTRLLQQLSANELAARVYDVRAIANPDLDPVDLGRYAGIGTPASRELRATYKLEDVIRTQRGQLAQQLALTDWVHRQWQHDGTAESDDKTALAILRQVRQGKRFACVDYGYALRDVLLAFGYPARVPALLPDGPGKGLGHRVTEVWNDELGKWIVLDGQNNAVWRDGDRYLSAAEVHELLVTHKTDRMRFERAASPWGAVKPEDEPAQRAFWVDLFAHVFVDGVNVTTPGERYVLVDLLGNPVHAKRSSDLRAVYPRLNLVHVELAPAAAKGAPRSELEIQLTHAMPGFDHYRVVRDGAAIELRQPSLVWRLHAGTNRLEVWAVNAAGVRGASSRFEVDFYPPRR